MGRQPLKNYFCNLVFQNLSFSSDGGFTGAQISAEKALSWTMRLDIFFNLFTLIWSRRELFTALLCARVNRA